jgi:prepilin-type processing-associated H-X9-DG protein
MNWNNPVFRANLEKQPQVLVCPSNEYSGPREDQFPYTAPEVSGAWLVATTCYKGNAGDGPFQEIVPPHNDPIAFWTHNPAIRCYLSGDDCYGVFWRYSYRRGGVKLREITDGSSNTFLIGEASPEDGNSPAWSSDGDWAVTAVQINWDWRSSGNCLSGSGEVDFNQPQCWSQMRGFRSYHPGGVQFALADGSVQFINDAINHLVYRAQSTKNWGEVIGDN